MSRGLVFPRIRTKLILIIMMAAVLPVCLAVIVLETLGYRAYRNSQGHLYEARAQHLALNIRDLVRQELESLDDWMTLSDLRAHVIQVQSAQKGDDNLLNDVEAVEARWLAASVDDPLVRTTLANEAADALNSFRAIHPLFAEIFVTDARGRLLASTAKTSDFYQADEDWWVQGAALGPMSHYVEGIHHDESAGVHSLDVAVPIRDRATPGAPIVGVLKGVLNVSALFHKSQPLDGEEGIIRQVIIPDGRVLTTLQVEGAEPLTDRINPAALQEILQKQSGSMIAKVAGEIRDLAGFAPLEISGATAGEITITGATPMFLLVRQPADTVLVPMRQQMISLGVGGAICLLGFVVAGYLIATHKLIEPIERMREAVRRIADSVRQDISLPAGMATPAAIEPLRKIRTHDELEDLATDFAGMARRLLGYNEHLEREISLKTEEISRDLQLAREFQEALMPTSFPRVPSEPASAPLSLNFRHLYKPALSVGGDFFDVLKLDEYKAGVFIADVMGHGARSALVTAILRTLLQNLAAESEEPARFLTTLNKLFHNSISNSGDTIFVSAFYLVLDTRAATANFASAGHPSPFRAHQESNTVEPLLETLHGNPALGFLANASYQQWTLPISPGDVFVLFTDGVHEAYRHDGEEFGLERMRKIIREQLLQPQPEIPTAIVAELQQFIAPAHPADDICIVSLEVKGSAVVAAVAETETPLLQLDSSSQA
jgi:sigma-B regulation protein RsbU (phosphoserine phosphatase)